MEMIERKNNGFTFKANTHTYKRMEELALNYFHIFFYLIGLHQDRPRYPPKKLGEIKWILLHKLNWLNYFLIVPYANFSSTNLFIHSKWFIYTGSTHRFIELYLAAVERLKLKQRENEKKINHIVWKNETAEKFISFHLMVKCGIFYGDSHHWMAHSKP